MFRKRAKAVDARGESYWETLDWLDRRGRDHVRSLLQEGGVSPFSFIESWF